MKQIFKAQISKYALKLPENSATNKTPQTFLFVNSNF